MVKILLFRKKKASPIYGSTNVLIDRVNGSNYRGLRGKRVRKNWIKREKNRWGARNRKQIRSGGRFRRSLSVEKRVMKRENPSIYFELKRYGRRSRKKFLSFFPSFFAKRNSAPIFLTNFQPVWKRKFWEVRSIFWRLSSWRIDWFLFLWKTVYNNNEGKGNKRESI